MLSIRPVEMQGSVVNSQKKQGRFKSNCSKGDRSTKGLLRSSSLKRKEKKAQTS